MKCYLTSGSGHHLIQVENILFLFKNAFPITFISGNLVLGYYELKAIFTPFPFLQAQTEEEFSAVCSDIVAAYLHHHDQDSLSSPGAACAGVSLHFEYPNMMGDLVELCPNGHEIPVRWGFTSFHFLLEIHAPEGSVLMILMLQSGCCQTVLKGGESVCRTTLFNRLTKMFPMRKKRKGPQILDL